LPSSFAYFSLLYTSNVAASLERKATSSKDIERHPCTMADLDTLIGLSLLSILNSIAASMLRTACPRTHKILT